MKTGDGATHRGFESHSLRQNTPHPIRGAEYFNVEVGFKEGGLAVGGAYHHVLGLIECLGKALLTYNLISATIV